MRLQVQGELSSNNGAGAQPRGVVRFFVDIITLMSSRIFSVLGSSVSMTLLSLLTLTTSQLGTLVSVARNEGLTALYSGIVPGLQRQMAFSAIRCHLVC